MLTNTTYLMCLSLPFSEERGRAKGSVYEGGLRIPMIVSWPGKVAPGSVSDHISAFWDFLPTIEDISNSPTNVSTDGESFLAEISGQSKEQAKHDFLYWEYEGKQAVRKNNWKAIRLDAKDAAGEIVLFDLVADPVELQNIAAENPDIVAEMEKIMNEAHQPCKDDWQQKWNLVPAIIDE
jgi:arylsulfatase